MRADLLVKHGNFEVFAIDQRGFGQSGGRKGILENGKDIYDDQWLFVFEVIKNYNIN